jgi:hypothetical protein
MSEHQVVYVARYAVTKLQIDHVYIATFKSAVADALEALGYAGLILYGGIFDHTHGWGIAVRWGKGERGRHGVWGKPDLTVQSAVRKIVAVLDHKGIHPVATGARM